jgi:hypothetical protein
MLRQGIMLLTRFCQDDRIQIIRSLDGICRSSSPARLPGRTTSSPTSTAIGKLDGKRCLLEWKTSSSRYPEEPEGCLSLDPQLVCYSWMTGIAEVAQVVFVRKRLVEVQYLRTTITDEQREEFRLVENTIRRIESADFLPHSGIRFPQNPCSSCPYVGLCLGKQEMADAAWCGVQEQRVLIGLTSLITRIRPCRRSSIAAAPCSCWARSTRFWLGSSARRRSGTPSSSNSGATYARCGRDSTGGWRN